MENAFIVIETKRGSANPTKVWSATCKVDYISRVQAASEHSDADFEDFEQVKADDEDRHDMRVQIMRKPDFMAYDTECLDKRVVDVAASLGWIDGAENEF